MENIIASYLFQKKQCPLPGIGNLVIRTVPAQSNFTEKLMIPPRPVVYFEDKETGANGLERYAAAVTGANVESISGQLNYYFSELKNSINSLSGARLNGIGHFSSDGEGQINFIPEELPETLLQPVTAERVIHPKAEHNILVGDKETTNTVMSDFYTETVSAKSKWWIWAIVLAVAAILIILFYYTETLNITSFGNAFKI